MVRVPNEWSGAGAVPAARWAPGARKGGAVSGSSRQFQYYYRFSQSLHQRAESDATARTTACDADPRRVRFYLRGPVRGICNRTGKSPTSPPRPRSTRSAV